MFEACMLGGCPTPAVYGFQAVTGRVVEWIQTESGQNVRACNQHLFLVVDQISAAMAQLEGGGPARIRTVPLTGAFPALHQPSF